MSSFYRFETSIIESRQCDEDLFDLSIRTTSKKEAGEEGKTPIEYEVDDFYKNLSEYMLHGYERKFE